MKHQLKNQLQQLAAFLGFILSVLLMAAFIGLFANCPDDKVNLKILWAIGFIVTAGSGCLLSKWINRHFIDGEWL